MLMLAPADGVGFFFVPSELTAPPRDSSAIRPVCVRSSSRVVTFDAAAFIAWAWGQILTLVELPLVEFLKSLEDLRQYRSFLA
jgi:hypothetical protein